MCTYVGVTGYGYGCVGVGIVVCGCGCRWMCGGCVGPYAWKIKGGHSKG